LARPPVPSTWGGVGSITAQDTDVYTRWRRPATWGKPGRVTLANVQAVEPHEPMHSALLAAGVDLAAVPLRDAQGGVNASVADSDVVVSGGARLGEDVFGALRATRLLLRPYVGYDDIDVEAATRHGILVANVPDAITEDVANQAMALILAVNRELLRLDTFVRDGEWARIRKRKPDSMALHRPSVQTLGLVGFGNIAQATARRARAFGYHLMAHDPFVPHELAEQLGVELVALDELLRRSDVVSVHTFLSDETYHLIDAGRLAQMKPGAWLVNTARGKLVDEEALVAALGEGRIAGAALDVMEQEPLDPASPLTSMDNVILCPHVAGYSEEGIRQLRTRGAEIALQVARGGLPERKVVINRGLYDELAALPELEGVPRA
jgi:D-3-phosphoglycerate dehydrogenase / 2-oxoglutarate reductase